jgi:hypothetical protein
MSGSSFTLGGHVRIHFTIFFCFSEISFSRQYATEILLRQPAPPPRWTPYRSRHDGPIIPFQHSLHRTDASCAPNLVLQLGKDTKVCVRCEMRCVSPSFLVPGKADELKCKCVPRPLPLCILIWKIEEAVLPLLPQRCVEWRYCTHTVYPYCTHYL